MNAKIILASLLGISMWIAPLMSETNQQAAEKLVKILITEDNWERTMNELIKRKPQLQEQQDFFNAFWKKHLNADIVRKETAFIYMQKFTQKELNEIYNFFNTPTGKKWTNISPEIIAEELKIGAAIMEKHKIQLQMAAETRQNIITLTALLNLGFQGILSRDELYFYDIQLQRKQVVKNSPLISALLEGHDQDKLKDAWGNNFEITMHNDRVYVRSSQYFEYLGEDPSVAALNSQPQK